MPRLKAYKWDAWADARAAQYRADQPSVVAVDVETPGTAYYDEPFCVTLTWRGKDGSLQNAYIALVDDFGEAPRETLQRRIRLTRELLASTPVWVFHNAKFDLEKLDLIDALPLNWEATHELEDTQVIFHLLDENEKKALKHLAVVVLKHDDTIMVPYKSGKKKGQLHPVAAEKHRLDRWRKKLGLTMADGFYYLPRHVVIPYALRDTDFTLELFEKGKPRLESLNDERLMALYRAEIELIDVFMRIESHGFALRLDYLEEKKDEYDERLMELWTELGDVAGDPEFNPNAPAQILPILTARGHEVEDTKESTLKKLDDSFASDVLAYRSAKKMHDYVAGLLAEQRDGIVHPWFNTVGPRTGRMSSGKAVA